MWASTAFVFSRHLFRVLKLEVDEDVTVCQDGRWIYEILDDLLPESEREPSDQKTGESSLQRESPAQAATTQQLLQWTGTREKCPRQAEAQMQDCKSFRLNQEWPALIEKACGLLFTAICDGAGISNWPGTPSCMDVTKLLPLAQRRTPWRTEESLIQPDPASTYPYLPQDLLGVSSGRFAVSDFPVWVSPCFAAFSLPNQQCLVWCGVRQSCGNISGASRSLSSAQSCVICASHFQSYLPRAPRRKRGFALAAIRRILAWLLTCSRDCRSHSVLRQLAARREAAGEVPSLLTTSAHQVSVHARFCNSTSPQVAEP